MGLEQTQKREFKMKSIYTTKKRGWLMQIEWKWCDELNRGIFKHKFYTVCNFWEDAPLPPYNILCAFPQGLHSNVTFPQDFQMGVPKLGFLMSQNFGHSSNQVCFENARKISYNL
jgi:hypothetical protein